MSDYADEIAASVPLPPTWHIDIPMSEELMEMIVEYGAVCARRGYIDGFGQVTK